MLQFGHVKSKFSMRLSHYEKVFSIISSISVFAWLYCDVRCSAGCPDIGQAHNYSILPVLIAELGRRSIMQSCGPCAFCLAIYIGTPRHPFSAFFPSLFSSRQCCPPTPYLQA